jgi:hypothetical protein
VIIGFDELPTTTQRQRPRRDRALYCVEAGGAVHLDPTTGIAAFSHVDPGMSCSARITVGDRFTAGSVTTRGDTDQGTRRREYPGPDVAWISRCRPRVGASINAAIGACMAFISASISRNMTSAVAIICSVWSSITVG